MNKWNKLRKQNLGGIPTEASANLNAPETAPSRSTNKINIRTKPLNFKVSEEFYWQLKDLAVKKKCLMVEIIEKSLECYEKEQKTSNFKEIIKEKFTDKLVDNEKEKPVNQPVQPLNKIPTINYQVDEQINNFCSFFIRDKQNNRITCDKPSFDRKKSLCRSHNRQVRNRFNQFLKGQSISSSAGWEMAWEQSENWQYFWELSEKDGEG